MYNGVPTICRYDGVRRAGSRDYVGNLEEPHTDPNIPLKKIVLTLSWQTPTLSLRVPFREHPHRTRNERVGDCHDRVGIIFLSGGWGSVWGSSRRLQVFYVIPRSGVVRHMHKPSRTMVPDPVLYFY